MGQNIDNQLTNCNVNSYVGGNQINNFYSMLQEKERKFVVTHNTNIKPVYYFTGREIELQELRQRIEEKQKSVLISGMGGIGKTTICRKLFEEYTHDEEKRKLFRHIGYIEYNGDMDSSLQECLIYKKQDNPERNREAAWRELNELAFDGKLLLFVDNVNKSMSEDVGLQRLNTILGAVILTSRRTFFNSEFEPHRIGFLSTEQCMEIYEKILFENGEGKVAEEEEQDLKYIIEKLAARHTITIKFLAQLANTKDWKAKRLREELEQRGFQIEYENEEDELINLQQSYETLYDLSELTKEEQNILEAFSVFPYIPLSAEICNRWLLLDAGVKSESDILKRLYRKGWLEFDIIQKSYTLHPVFAQFIYTKCKPRMEDHLGLIKECQQMLEMPEDGSAQVCQFYIPFAENIIEKIEMGESEKQVDFIMTLACLLDCIAEYTKARELYERGLHICKKVLGKKHPFVTIGYNNLAGVYASQGNYEKAEELCKKSICICEEILGEENPNTASSYNSLARIYQNQGKYKKAEELYEKSLQVREKILGKEHPDTVNSYNNLAGLYESQGEYKKAIELYEKSVLICEKLFGEKHLKTAIVYNNLAKIYQSQEKYKEVEELYKRSLCIRKKVLGEEHPHTANVYNNLAGLYREQKKYEKAEKLYKRSIYIYEKVLGEEHLATADVYNNLAVVYERQRKYKEAEQLCKKNISIYEKVLGKEHPDIAISYNNLAGLYYDQKEYNKAEELYEKSISIYKKVLEKEHPNIAISYSNLARIYKIQGKYEIAVAYFLKAYKIFVHKLGLKHSYTKIVYDDMETLYSEWNPKGNFIQWIEEKMKELL